MEVISVRTPGLGDATYVVAHDGLGIVVDPQRDIDRFEEILDVRGLELRWVLETHLHNDYISGGKDLAARRGADLVLPAGSGAGFVFTPAFHQEDLPAERGLSIRPLHTPGHTPEHTSYLVLVDGEPVAVFTGGSLLVGSAGRPDLLSHAQTEPLARLQYVSVNRLAQLPDDTGLYPTHGEGSFCTASGAGKSVSTIGDEKRTNPVLAQPDVDAFLRHTLSDLQPWPSYYRHMGPANVFGPSALDNFTAPRLTPADVADRDDDVYLIDARDRADYADGHIPGSVAIGLEDRFGVWLGWVVPWAAPLQLVLDGDSGPDEVEEAVRQLGRVGYTDVRGVLHGLGDWEAEGRPLERFDRVAPADLAARLDAGEQTQVLDVRAPAEVDDEPLDGAVVAYVPELAGGIPQELDETEPVWVVCGSGYRATIAASLLARAGYRPIIVDGGGVADVNAARTSTPATA